MRLRSAAALSLVPIALVAGASAADASTSKTVDYLGATLIDGWSAMPKQNMMIVTTGNRITAVLSAEHFEPKSDDEVVDVRSKFILPGLINTHVHLATLADPAVAKAYLRRELYSGVTTVRDMAGDARLLGELKREAQLDEVPSPDIYFVALMAGPSFFVDPRTHDSARGEVAGQVPWMQTKETGTIEPGKLANMVVLDRNPLDDIANVGSVAIVVKLGTRYPRADYRPATAADFAPVH